MPTLSDLKPDPRNPRIHGERNIEMVAGLLRDVGAARSIVIDETRTILAGNGVVEAAKRAGIDRVRIVEADGDELIAVQRRGLTPSQKAHLKIGDNRTSELAEWDGPVVLAYAEEEDLSAYWRDDEWAILFADGDDLPSGDEPEEKYSTAIESPIYTPTGERPAVRDLADTERHDALLAAIEASTVPDEVKLFLRRAAARHVVFDYRGIAEFYAHADAETQGLMEDSALVIIDVDRAIELGYARLRETLIELRAEAIDG